MAYPELVKANNTSDWDWITWETLGNSDPKFQKGDVAMKLGLWRSDYVELCRAGTQALAAPHGGGVLGAGWVRIHTIRGFDYRPHAALIKTFLPFMTIDNAGNLVDPLTQAGGDQVAVGSIFVVLPYNYDDNSARSAALGTTFQDIIGARIEATLERWSTASRSSLARVKDNGVPAGSVYVYQPRENTWPWRPKRESKDHIFGTNIEVKPRDSRFSKTLKSERSPEKHFYTVKSGVQYVGSEDQGLTNNKWRIKDTVLAMKHSELIHTVSKGLKPNTLETRYQLDILNVQLNTGEWDGFQVRDIGARKDEIWFPALAIPGSGKAFALSWAGQQTAWSTFWKDNFATPLGRGKAEMLAFFGLQHQTSNAQNMVIAFNTELRGPKSKCLILRDLGDTLLNDHANAALRPLGEPFVSIWTYATTGEEGHTLSTNIGGNYGNALMVRTGATVVFFFPPFMKGDLESGAAKTLARWGIAHNEGFLQYFRDKVGYTDGWQTTGIGITQPPPDIEGRLKKLAADMKPADEYTVLKDDVLAMNSQQRQTLISSLAKQAVKLQANEPNVAKHLVGAHDMLIGAEVECYLKSAAGKQNLLDLHRKSRR